ncbi:hypothetical protein PILCRDRAFT_821647 [Piloderma croceum F 1598]|uniref:Uncharacterized protein n=1 Tax=Piloderma croceum (strain F 1598) TaxID=765440 RepID=A0A0C3FNA5_PILCF|nr:hypothetical protein PILCRDRAFT_821647 [Piloderma croceum F 1598]
MSSCVASHGQIYLFIIHRWANNDVDLAFCSLPLDHHLRTKIPELCYPLGSLICVA